MKRLISLLLLVLIIVSFTGCAEKITMDNIENVETEHQYSRVVLGKYLVKTDETKIVVDAKEFAKKFISVQQNRAYNKNTDIENEKIMYTSEYVEKQGEELDKIIEDINSFYAECELKTELQSVDYNKVINLSGDAYVDAVAKIRLTNCNNPEIAEALGFKNGINSNVLCEYSIKMKYIDGEYFIYDYSINEKDGYLVSLKNYRDVASKILRFGIQNEYEISEVVRKIAYAQNNRDYKTLIGDEDYPYLTDSYISMLNKDRDDVAYTKKIYNDYKLVTELVSCNIINMRETSRGCEVRADLKVKLAGCVSDTVAKNIGYINGIGSEEVMQYSFLIINENGKYKLLELSLLN